MNKERNWSAIQDHLNGGFGQRSYYTKQDWIEQCMEWCYGGMPDEEDGAIEQEQREYLDWLNEISAEELMLYISENWEIEIRETTWLEEGNKCYWRDPAGETSGIYTIAEIRCYDEPLSKDTIILLTSENSEAEVTIDEIYGLTDERCPKCGSPLYVSDLCQYQCVCLECDENFY